MPRSTPTESSILRLPNELLIAIIEAWSMTSRPRLWERQQPVNRVPFVASRLCSRWRAVTLSTPTLWTDIVVTIKEKRNETLRISLPDYDACLAYLALVRKRSGDCPVQLAFADIRGAHPPFDHSIWTELRALLSRAQSITIHDAFWAFPWMSDGLTRYAGDIRMPLLDQLTFASPWDSTTAPPMDSFPFLQPTPHVTSLVLDRAVFPLLAPRDQFPNLRSLSYSTLVPVLVEELDEMLTRHPALESFRLNAPDVAAVWHRKISSRITTFRLALHHLNDDSVVQFFSFPRLEAADIHFEHSTTLSDFLVNCLPDASLLVSLILREMEFARDQLLMPLPNLRKLELHSCRYPNPRAFFIQIKEPQTFPSLSELTLSSRQQRAPFTFDTRILLWVVRGRRKAGQPLARVTVQRCFWSLKLENDIRALRT
ncbi:hypothetical protein EXIGLDRAFT_729189 [Exidia glandulosa HHB12029]|uniref:F-box domain-containing protein n=1 Tax=Exidia glandulosa HHB12029 TaxID=1314781 RepID=A0A165LLN7_EXIGL|nr:hypothetical protein EXIGLDRAFT_729189 [Exidia glandulosa HHB12029]